MRTNFSITKKTSPATFLKIAAVYAFALTTAVACGKFSTKDVQVTTRGKGAVVTQGAINDKLSISQVQTVFLGTEEFGDYSWSIKLDVSHGEQKLKFELFPSVTPISSDIAYHESNGTAYMAQAVCGNYECSKFAVLVAAKNNSGMDLQTVELWDKLQNGVSPLKRLTNTDFHGVTQAYETLTGEKLPVTYGD